MTTDTPNSARPTPEGLRPEADLSKLLWIVINVATAAIFVGHYKLCLRSA